MGGLSVLFCRMRRACSERADRRRRAAAPLAPRDGRSRGPGAVSLTRLQLGRSARAAESARLEIVCWATNRGFKSHLLRFGDMGFTPPTGADADLRPRAPHTGTSPPPTPPTPTPTPLR